MSKSLEKEKAISLRKSGLSVGSIAKQLSVSKASVSLWCRDIVLTKAQKETLFLNAIKKGEKGRMIGAEMNRNKKVKNVKSFGDEGRLMIGKISKRDLLIAGTALYWAEGSKKDNKLSIVNSDPKLILLAYKWFKDILGVKKQDFMPRIFINELHGYRIQKVLSFWSFLLELPTEQFGKPVLLKVAQKKKYNNQEEYFGVLALRVSKGTLLKYKVMGLIDGLDKMSR